jgi:predicted site-specific integrase-resolvase
MMKDRLLSLGETAKILGVSEWYLRRSESLPVILTDGGHRRYKESDIKALLGIQEPKEQNLVVIYSRVSSQDQKQKGDLDRQKIRNYDYCTEQGYKIIESFEECGSGMNDNRPKLRRIIELAGQGKFQKLIVEHKDRLTRFNFNIMVLFFKQLGVDVICIEEILPKSFENELVEDMLGLLSSFSAKIYGKRSHQNKKKQ